jgi:hypothetical protein
MIVDDQPNQAGIDALPGRIRPSATRAENRTAISTEPPPKSNLEKVEQDFRAELIYLEWDAIRALLAE